MEIDKNEVAALEQAVNEVAQKEILELSDLHLAFIGGGIGSVIVG